MEDIVKRWIEWRRRSDRLEVNRATGWKPSGVEYRIMLEGKAASIDPKRPFVWQQLMEDMDEAYRRIFVMYPDHMRAVEIYYGYGEVYRHVRKELHVSQYASRKLVNEGMDMLKGGLACIAIGIEEEN